MTLAHLTKRQLELIDAVLGDEGTVVLRSQGGSDLSAIALEVALEAARRRVSVIVVADSLGAYTFYERAFSIREVEEGNSFIAIQSAADLRLLIEDAAMEGVGLFGDSAPCVVAGDALERPFVAKELGNLRSGLLIVDGQPRNVKRSEIVDAMSKYARRNLILLGPGDAPPASVDGASLIEMAPDEKPESPVLEFRLAEVELAVMTNTLMLLRKHELADVLTDPTRPSLYEGLALLQEDSMATANPFEPADAQEISQAVLTQAEHFQGALESLGSDPRLETLVEALADAPRPIAVISRDPSDASFLSAVLEELLVGERVWRASERLAGPPPFDIVVFCDLDIEGELVRRGAHSLWWDRPEDDLRAWYSGAGCVGRIQLVTDQQLILLAALSKVE